MKRFLLITLLALPPAIAAPFQPAQIPAEARWYLHGDLTGIRQTTTGSIIFKELRKKEADKIEEIQNLFGFDLLKELTDITLFGSGKADEAAIILSGKFDRSRLEKAISQADQYKNSKHGTATIHEWEDNGSTQHAAFHGDQTVVISPDKKLLTLGLDVLSGDKPGLDPGLTLPSKDPVIVAFARVKDIDMPIDDGSRIVRKADSVLLTIGEKNERLVADMVVEADTGKTAKRIMHILQGLVSLGELADEEIEDLDLDHQGRAEGKTMTMSMSLPAAKALALLKELD